MSLIKKVTKCLLFVLSTVALNRREYIAVATIEADEAIASSDFLKIMGISSQKGANRGDSDQL